MEKKDLLDGCSSKHHQHCNELLININEDNWEPKQECSIYRVPKHLRDVNAKAYTPQVVSIGPFHHGNSELAFMEKHKKRCARRVYQRIGFEKWKLVETFIKENKETVFNYYEGTFNLESNEFEKMLLLDAIFVVEYLSGLILYNDDDVLHRGSWLNSAITVDFMLLENQLPYFLLKGLYETAFYRSSNQYSFLNISSYFFSRFTMGLDFKNIKELDIKHFTDLLRDGCLNLQALNLQALDDKSKKHRQNVRSATKLHNAGLTFKPIKVHKSGLKFKSIKDGPNYMVDGKDGPNYMVDVKFTRKLLLPFFEVCELHLPSFELNNMTEPFVRNVMAMEQCHYPRDTHFCNYIILLDNLIDTKEDVELLVEHEILTNWLGGPTEATEMINKLTKNITVSRSCFMYIIEKLGKNYYDPWNRAKATLANLYFSNRWKGTATLAAIVLLLLTLMQTICSILQVI